MATSEPAVLYLKFSIPDRCPGASRRERPRNPSVELAIDHPNYAARVRLSPFTVAELDRLDA